jgi:hypothetical protein
VPDGPGGRAVPGGLAEPGYPGMAAVRAALGGQRLVVLADVDGRLAGLGVTARGSGLADLGPASTAADAAATTGAALRALAGFSTVDPRRSVDLLRRALAVLDGMLAPVSGGDGPVVLVVPAVLHTVPWHLVPVLAGRPVTVAPSVTWWYAAQRSAGGERAGAGAGAGSGAGGVTVVAGPRLVEAGPEAAAVARIHPGADLLTGPAAVCAAVTAAFTRSRLVHLACHARIRPDGPLWSSLELHDGPLWMYDLERLPATPDTVVLSGCHTGVGVRAGDDLLGLAGALLRNGTRRLVASVCALPDTAATGATMVALHERLAAGSSPATALAALSAGALSGGDPLAACLTTFGTI